MYSNKNVQAWAILNSINALLLCYTVRQAAGIAGAKVLIFCTNLIVFIDRRDWNLTFLLTLNHCRSSLVLINCTTIFTVCTVDTHE